MNFRAGLVALLTVHAARASLPASVSSNVYVPGDHVSSVRIPVLNDGAAGPGFIDPTTPSVQPLLITAVDADDLFFGFATADDESLDDFLLLGPDGNSHFLFSSWSEDSSKILRLRARNNARLKALSVKVAAQWTGRLHFTNVVVDHQLAEEMIYDADDDCSGRVSLDELIATLETVHIDESIDERVASTGAAEGGWLSKA